MFLKLYSVVLRKIQSQGRYTGNMLRGAQEDIVSRRVYTGNVFRGVQEHSLKDGILAMCLEGPGLNALTAPRAECTYCPPG